VRTKIPGPAACAALLSVLVACDGDSGEPATHGELLISAAASLTDALADMASAFEAANPQVRVALNFAGTSRLRTQILEGAPVDVFAAASTADMDQVAAAGGVAGKPRIFARNHLRIAVPRGNPAAVTGPDDFARTDLLLGLCAPAVPCGALAWRALAAAGISPSIDTEEPDVRALLTKIELGELDAGIVYATDVAAADGTVEGIDLPTGVDIFAEYVIGALAGARYRAAAWAFVEFVLSSEGRAILGRHGFLAPESRGAAP
jgi:molybdate transport system substrate-binding protein